MQTAFTPDQLRNPAIEEANKILRSCVHCGFCTATCPTYVLLGDELDGPRGRIYLIKDMLENDRVPAAGVVKHVDRCLSCLSCMTTCPSGVDYTHLIDGARERIADRYRRPWRERAFRWMLANTIPNRRIFRMVLIAATAALPLRRWGPRRLKAMFDLLPRRSKSFEFGAEARVFPAMGERKKRIALLSVCAQSVLAPEVDAATIRLLNRHGVEVVVARRDGCCGALVHHMGHADQARNQAAANVEAWWRETREGGGEGLDAVIVNASGCGTMVKDYGNLFRDDPVWADKANAISAIACDITELMAEIGLRAPVVATGQRIAYHSACSMQHGQRIIDAPRQLLKSAGFDVVEIAEGHLCCGSAGVYNLVQPEMAARLRSRKVENIEATDADAVAAGNIGCIVQIASESPLPVAHTVEYLDWATGGPMPAALSSHGAP